MVRIWIHYDANKELKLYDGNGHFQNLPSNFYNDFKSLLQISKEANIKLFVTLFSFECVNTDNCYNMIADTSKSQSYIDNGLSKIL